MINNFNDLIVKTLEKSQEKKLKFKLLDNYNFSLHCNDLNSLLEIIFKYCSKNNFSFNIIRDEFDFIKVEIFDSLEINTVFINLIYDKNIEKEKTRYKKRLEKYKKIKIFPVVGPDGVGKTTLLTSAIDMDDKNIVYRRFKKIVRRSIIYNFMYPINKMLLKRKLGYKPEKDQHDDIHHILILLAGILYYPYLLYTAKIKKKTVIVDRFFNDYFLENISFLDKKTILRKNWKNLLTYVPTVYWKMHLDADPKIILSRKDELNGSDVIKYKSYNFKLYLEKPSFIYTYINTGLEINKCQDFLRYTYKNILDN